MFLHGVFLVFFKVEALFFGIILKLLQNQCAKVIGYGMLENQFLEFIVTIRDSVSNPPFRQN